MKPGHKMAITKVKGTFKASCCCGWSGPKQDTQDLAHADYTKHAGIMERLRL